MRLLECFQRTTRAHPCPICGRPDWCLISRDDPADPADVICQRVESRARWGDAGWIHARREGQRAPRAHARVRVVSAAPSAHFEQLQRRLRAPADDHHVRVLAAHLGVSAESLVRLGVGVAHPQDFREFGLRGSAPAWTFPMRDARGAIVGLRVRVDNGDKFAFRGSSNGLFIPAGITPPLRRLLIAEGESDVAALLDLGFVAVGRPGCTGGTQLLCRFTRRAEPDEVVIVADNDEPGTKGATTLASSLRAFCRRVRIVTPPNDHRDAREWVRAGARSADFLLAIERALVVGLSFSNNPTRSAP